MRRLSCRHPNERSRQREPIGRLSARRSAQPRQFPPLRPLFGKASQCLHISVTLLLLFFFFFLSANIVSTGESEAAFNPSAVSPAAPASHVSPWPGRSSEVIVSQLVLPFAQSHDTFQPNSPVVVMSLLFERHISTEADHTGQTGAVDRTFVTSAGFPHHFVGSFSTWKSPTKM